MLEHPGFLTSNDRRGLRRVLCRREHSTHEHGRANGILLIDDGVPIPLIAKLLFLDEQSIRSFFLRYLSGGADALLDSNNHGKESKLNDDQKGLLRQYVANLLDNGLVITFILLEFGVSCSGSGIHRLLHELGFVYKKPAHVPGKADAAKQAEFAARLHEFMAHESPDSRDYFMDTVHQQYDSVPACGWILKGADKEPPANSVRQRLKAYSPNLNLIKRLWHFMHEQTLYTQNKLVFGLNQDLTTVWGDRPQTNLRWAYNRCYAMFREFRSELLMFFDRLPDEFSDSLRLFRIFDFQVIS